MDILASDLWIYLSGAMGALSATYLVARGAASATRILRARRAYPAETQPHVVEPGSHGDRCRGALYGLALGDALNLPAESIPRWLVRLRYPSGPKMRRGWLRFLRRPGDISDDTQLTIAVARSFCFESEGSASGARIRSRSPLHAAYDHQRFIRELGEWSRFRVGAGRASARAASYARKHGRARGDRRSEGNGVAIRVLPFAMLDSLQGAELREVLELNGRATHDTDNAIAGAHFVCHLWRGCLRSTPGLLDDEERLRALLKEAAKVSGFNPQALRSTLANTPPQLQRAPTGHVASCIPAAAAVLLRHGSDFEAAMRTIFFHGGDTDSVGAIVGAAIGAQRGASTLPEKLLAPLQHRETLACLADRLTEAGDGRG